MLTVCCQKPPSFKPPRIVRKLRSAQKSRDRQLKTVVDDVTSIARKEIDRTSELIKELLDDPADNPIVIEKKGYESDTDEG